MAPISSFLSSAKDGAPFIFRLQVNEIFGIEESGGVCTVVGTADLGHNLRNFRKGGEYDARLIHDARALGRAGAGRESAARPDGAFVEMRQKFRADHAAEGEIDRKAHGAASDGDCHRTMLDGPTHGFAIASLQIIHHRIAPFVDAIPEEHAAEHRRDQHRENERAKERERNGPGHGPEQAAFDALQCEDGQVRGDDDGDGVKDRTLNFEGGVTDAFQDGFVVDAHRGSGGGRCFRP